jgi:pimeloyl-ACP methyl ester carboxylesterase
MRRSRVQRVRANLPAMATFGLVHGSWHGAWCWTRLIPELEARGHGIVAVNLPIEDPDAGLTRYAEVVADALSGVDDDVILVGHSFAGSTIPLVSRRRPVKQLVFLCALMPRPGETATDRWTSEDVYVPGFVGNTATRDDGASYWPDPGAAIRCFYHDCTAADAEWAVARLRAQSAAPRLEAWPLDALPDVPRASILCRGERVIDPAWSRTMSRELLGVEAIELEGGHSPFLSRPEELAAVLARLA